MSNRDSLGFGELLPQDVVDIFAQEKHSTRGQKKRSRSLGRALGWLKGKKRKDHNAKGKSPGLGPALDLALDVHPAGHQGGHKGGQKSGRQAHPQGHGHAVLKRDDDDKTEAPPMFQENVFIEASRPKYLENLHTEALEGLKMMQQEETNNGVEFQDNESTISTMSVHTDGEGGGFMTDSTIADTTSVVSVQSSVSTRSSRSGLTRQGSTFRPLNSGKKSEKTRRRRHRKTVGGIPQHVQRELGLDRTGWTQPQRLDEEFYNGESDLSPTSDGPQPGPSAILRETNDVHPLNKEQLDKLAALHKDDLALLHRLGPEMSVGQRPHSLAVPWMTTANSLQQEPPSPVITMSPQAAYMSKIIPNAVLPPSIEVVEISRGRSRNSVRTVSKSSLVLSSPAPSRASSRASTITSASRNPPNMSDSSGWSNSDSSETLVSDSSTISRSSTPKQRRPEDGDVSAKEDKISVSSNSKGLKYTSNGKPLAKVEEVKKEGPFARSLSVMKPKRAPPPPSRSYSLHKLKRRSRDLAEMRINSKESSLHNISGSGDENERHKSSPVPTKPIDSPGYHADTSSLDESPVSMSFSPVRPQQQVQKAEEAAKVEVDGLQEKQKPPQDKRSKVISPSSGYSSQDGTPAQPHSSSPRHKRGILAKLQRLFPGSSSAASTAPPPPQPESVKPDTTVDTVSPSVRALRELFNIPLPPKVHAPPPPPPEVWAHSKRSFELLLGPPVPDNLEAIIRKNPKDRRQQRQSPCASTEGSVKSLVVERKHKNPANGSVHVLETTKVQESVILSAEIQNDRLAEQNVDLKENSNVTEKVEKVRVNDLIAGMLVKAAEKREERLAAAKAEEAKKTTMDTLPAISLARIPPSPSPPPGHHPPHPPTKQTVVVVSPESSWPPPPPPMAPVTSDEIDFPLPPPPMFGEGGVTVPVQVPPDRSGKVTAEAEPQKTTTSQGVELQPLNIPPPPSYTAPPPPVKAVSPSPPTKKFTPLPPLKEVSPPPPQPPVTIILPPTPKEVSPPPPAVISPPPPPPPPPPPVTIIIPPKVKEVSPPPPAVISPPPPPPPVTVILPPTLKEASPPPPAVIPPPPPETVLLPPPLKEVSPPAQLKEVSPPPKEVSPPPPPLEVLLLPIPKELSPTKDVSPPPPKESPPLVQEAPPPLVQDVSVTLVTVVSSSPVKEASPPLVIEASTLSPPSSQESAPEEATSVSKLTPPQSIPPPPPLTSQPQSSEQETELPQEVNPVSLDVILTPPQSIPPAPPVQPEVVPPNPEAPATQEASPSPPPEVSIPPPSPEKAQEPPSPEKAQEPAPSPEKAPEPAPSPEKAPEPAPSPEKAPEPAPSPEKAPEPAPSPEKAPEPAPSPEKAPELAPSPVADIPLSPPLPVQGVSVIIKEQPSPASTETQTSEPTSTPVVKEETSPVVTPSLLQMVKLRSVSSSPEPPKAPEQPEAEVTMTKQEPSEPVPTTSTSAEAPQKPIRRSLIILSPSPTSPTSISPPATSPPATVIVQPALPKSQSILLPPASSSTAISPTKKSPPAMTASPSMNLQEAIRLRTAARSKESPVSRLSLHSPTSPLDLHKSPSSTASFIFSKSNKKVVIETRPAPEKKVVSEAESAKKEVKVPPPVAKKPKTKGKETETSEGMEHTAGQDAQQESIKDAAEKANGTAGTVEVGGTPSS